MLFIIITVFAGVFKVPVTTALFVVKVFTEY